MGPILTRPCSSGGEGFKQSTTQKRPKDQEDDITLAIVRELNVDKITSTILEEGYKRGLDILTNPSLEGSVLENGLCTLMDEESIPLFCYELEVHSGVDATYGIPLRIETARRGHELWWKIGNADATVWKQVDTNLRDLLMTTSTWNCNIFAIQELTQRPIAYVGYQMFRKYGFIEEYCIPEQQLVNFFDVMEHGYNMNKNPYHNSIHSADVLQSCTVLIDLALKIYDIRTMDVFALCIACIIHDYAHPGFTNAYLKTFYEEDNKSLSVGILENFHTVCAFKVLDCPECNIFVNLEPAFRKKLVKKIRDLVLFTDLARHFGFVGTWEQTKLSQRNLKDYDSRIGLTGEETLDLLRILIKSADLANAAKPWSLYDKWADAILDEFYLQGDTERQAGAQISMFMNRDQPEKSPCQFGFLSGIVGPLLTILFQVVPESQEELKENFESNLCVHTPGN